MPAWFGTSQTKLPLVAVVSTTISSGAVAVGWLVKVNALRLFRSEPVMCRTLVLPAVSVTYALVPGGRFCWEGSGVPSALRSTTVLAHRAMSVARVRKAGNSPATSKPAAAPTEAGAWSVVSSMRGVEL